MKRIEFACLAALTWFFAGQALAMPMIEFTSLKAKFDNVVGGQNLEFIPTLPPPPEYSDPASIMWGGDDRKSWYKFDATDTLFSEVPDALFELGEFWHKNRPIPSGSSIESVDLIIEAKFDITNSANMTDSFMELFTFSFEHNETPNAADPCDGGTGDNGVGVNINGCADIVTVSGLPADIHFLVGSEAFTLEFVGFDANFVTPERTKNHAPLLAVFRASVPEPASLVLLGLGLVGLGFIRKRQ